MNTSNKRIWKQVQPSNNVCEDGYWCDEWGKFFVRNSWVFSRDAPKVKNLDEARELAKCDWAGIAAHRDAKGKNLDDQFGSWHDPRPLDRVVKNLEPMYCPPLKPLSSFISRTKELSQNLPYVVHLHIVGAEIQDDELWAARVWNMKKNREVHNSRTYAKFLGEVMTVIYQILRNQIPGFGDPEWNEGLDRQEAESDEAAEGVFQIQKYRAEQAFIDSPVKYNRSGVPVS